MNWTDANVNIRKNEKKENRNKGRKRYERLYAYCCYDNVEFPLFNAGC